MEKFYTVNEIAAIFGLESVVIRRKLVKKEIEGHKIGKEWRVSQSQLDEYLDRTSNKKDLESCHS